MKLSKKSVLVTGGAGFIGSHLVDRLLDRCERVRVLDNLSTGNTSNLNMTEIEFVNGDVTDGKSVKAAVKDIDVVFHLAAQINPARAVGDPIGDFEVNARGTLNLLVNCKSANIEKFVLSSTNVYGNANTHTMAENFSTLFERNSILSPYAASKICAEAYCKVFNDELGLPTVRLRYFNVYGPRQTTKTESGVVAIFAKSALFGKPLQIFGDGTKTRDFVYVSDVVEANLLVAEKDEVNGEVFNVGTGVETSIKDLARMILEITGADVPIVHLVLRAADFNRAKADLTRSKQILGYESKVNFRDGLTEYIDWCRKYYSL